MNLWLNNKLPHQSLLVHLLLASVILAVYYPAMLGGVHTIDDPGIISLYSTSPPLSQVLLPGNGYYYRPLVEISFWLDNLLWGMEPRVMHLENILLHMGNSALVFLLARRISARYDCSTLLIPLFAALLFALHPLNVEAVGWIAGRTDPLLALFCLLACHFWLRWLDEPRWQSMLIAGVLFICGALTKESALAFIPVFVLLTTGWHAGHFSLSDRKTGLIGVVFLSGALLALVGAVRGGSVTAVTRLLAPVDAGAWRSAQDVLAAFGFYCKKLLLPLPLDFAITEVAPLYALPGVGVLLLLALMLRRGAVPALFFAAAALMALPPLVLVLRHISWTPVAERYMYLPTAFLSLGIAGYLAGRPKKALTRLAPFLVLLLCASAVVVSQRNVLWQNKLLFYRDAVSKAPGFGALHNELGALLLRDGNVVEAAGAFRKAERLNERPALKLVIKGNIMATMVAQGDYLAARNYFFGLFNDKKEAPPLFLEMLQSADLRRLPSLTTGAKDALAQDIVETLVLLHDKTHEPFWLYQCGKLELSLQSHLKASEFFRRAYVAAPPDAHYRLAAQKQLFNLEGRR